MTPLLWAVAVLLLPLANGAPVSGSDGGSRNIRIPATYNPQFKPNPHALKNTIRKWQNRIARHQGIFTSEKDSIANVTARDDQNDLDYLSLVGYGTPPQWLPVDFDTGSADVWVYSDLMLDSDLVGSREYYHTNASSTAVLDPDAHFDISYGDGSEASGGVFDDVVTIGGIEIHHAAVEAAKKVIGNIKQNPASSGIFGLALGMPSQVYPHKPTVLSELLKLLDQKAFTVDLKYHADGEYEFGTVDQSKLTDNYGLFDLVPLPDPGLPGIQFWSLNYTIPSGNTEYASEGKQRASRACIIDTGSTAVVLSTDQAEAYYSQVQDVIPDRYYGYIFPCNQHLPDFHISFGGDNIYTIPGRYLAYGGVPELEGMCQGGILADDTMDFAIIGDMFLKSVYAVFDVENAAVGFANKPLN